MEMKITVYIVSMLFLISCGSAGEEAFQERDGLPAIPGSNEGTADLLWPDVKQEFIATCAKSGCHDQTSFLPLLTEGNVLVRKNSIISRMSREVSQNGVMPPQGNRFAKAKTKERIILYLKGIN